MQQRVALPKMAEGVERDLDDVGLATGREPVEGVDILEPLLTGGAPGSSPCTQAWKMNVSLGQGE